MRQPMAAAIGVLGLSDGDCVSFAAFLPAVGKILVGIHALPSVQVYSPAGIRRAWLPCHRSGHPRQRTPGGRGSRWSSKTAFEIPLLSTYHTVSKAIVWQRGPGARLPGYGASRGRGAVRSSSQAWCGLEGTR